MEFSNDSKYWTDGRASILAGCDRDLPGPFCLNQMWDYLMLQQPSIYHETALMSTLEPEGISISITFKQLDCRASYLAQHINKNYKRPEGDWTIAVCLPPSVELITTLLAIFKAGAAYLPLDPTFPNERVYQILTDANPALLFSTTQIYQDKNFTKIAENVTLFYTDTYFGEIECKMADIVLPMPTVPQQDLAVVLYTSGSTGTPKGSRITHYAIHNRLHWQWNTFPYVAGEVAMFKTSLTFVDSIIEIWAPLLKGKPIVIVPKTITQNPQHLVNALERFKITRIFLVPSLLSSILSYTRGKIKLRSLRLWFCSGESLSVHLLNDFFQQLNGTVCNLYGSTEITDVTYFVFHCKEVVNLSIAGGQVPLGLPLDNCAIYILNSMGEPVQHGQIGEIFVSGAHVTDNQYIKREDLNSLVSFVTNNIQNNKQGHQILYRTGDFGRIINGKLYYEGRSDSQIKVRGHRVDLTEVNAVLNSLDQVDMGVVLCWKPGHHDQEIVAFVMSSLPSTIHSSLRKKILFYEMPRIVLVDKIPLLTNGKIDRQHLLRDYEKNYKTNESCFQWNEEELSTLDEKGRNLARILFETISSTLGTSLQKPLTLVDNFFYVGGNSINAVVTVTKLRDQGFYLEISEFLEAESLQHIVFKMEKNNCINQPQLCYLDNHHKITKYTVEPLNASFKEEAMRILCKGFAEKGDLEILTGVTFEDNEPIYSAVFESSLREKLSFVVKDEKNNVVACSLNCDALNGTVLPHPTTARMKYVVELWERAWELAREQENDSFRELLIDWKKGQVMRGRKVATDITLLSAAENVAVVEFVEREILLVAKKNGFQSVAALNLNPLTQQICNDVLNYNVAWKYQVNQFVATDGTKPFAKAPDSFMITISFKRL